jgi:hypothetical protein
MKLIGPEEMAQIVIDSADFHEKTWNKEAFRLEEETIKRKYPDGSYTLKYGWIGPPADYFYHYSIEESIQIILRKRGHDERFTYLIYLALSSWMNDALDWAEHIISIAERR